MTTIWMYGVSEPTSYHDSSCTCVRHCLNCRSDLDGHDGSDPRPARARYCSDYCKGQMKRERAIDRQIIAAMDAKGAAR